MRNIHDGLLCISDLISELNCPKLRSFVHDVEFGEDDFNDGVTHLCSKVWLGDNQKIMGRGFNFIVACKYFLLSCLGNNRTT